MIRIDEEILKNAVLGGTLLGGGSGGEKSEGEELGKLALSVGNPTLASIDELEEDDILITVSAVGAPAAKGQYVKPIHYVKAVELLERTGLKIAGLITSENAGRSTINGWFQSAILEIPVVDAPCNGRAHPTGLMGSMGLHKIKNYISKQAAVGGDYSKNRFIEMFICTNIFEASRVIRKVAVSAGGLIAIARNPITVSYARDNAAVGGISQAIEIGKIMRNAQRISTNHMIEMVLKFLRGSKITEGKIYEVELKTLGGFDVGNIKVRNGNNIYELTFCNEYMCLEHNGQRIATFPDLIATINLSTGVPLTTSEIKEGQEVAIIHIPKQNLKLGAGMKDPEIFKPIEEIINKNIIKYGGGN